MIDRCFSCVFYLYRVDFVSQLIVNRVLKKKNRLLLWGSVHNAGFSERGETCMFRFSVFCVDCQEESMLLFRNDKFFADWSSA